MSDESGIPVKGFVADLPDDISGLEQWDRDRYTGAGKRLYPWFLASALITLALFVVACFVLVAAGGRITS